MMTTEPEWAHVSTPYHIDNLSGDVQLWPPSMGRWPLLVARQEEATTNSETAAWAATIVGALEPAISTLSAKIENLNWK